jgi:hypothetical protein
MSKSDTARNKRTKERNRNNESIVQQVTELLRTLFK